jgi:DNA-binding PadR family transcriptional regulator
MYRTDTSPRHGAGRAVGRGGGGVVLELAVLGLLQEAPLHGYELRQRLKATLGTFRAFSYGSLYPTLRRMQAAGWITQDEGDAQVVAGAPPLTGRRGKVVYKLTAEGKERFAELLTEAGPSAWEDETFGVHFAFFGQTDPEVRVRILEGRRRRLEERREGVRTSLARTRSRLDRYTLQLQEHGLESVEREVRWLTELIETERRSVRPPPAAPPPAPSAGPPSGPSAARPPAPPTTTGRGAP